MAILDNHIGNPIKKANVRDHAGQKTSPETFRRPDCFKGKKQGNQGAPRHDPYSKFGKGKEKKQSGEGCPKDVRRNRYSVEVECPHGVVNLRVEDKEKGLDFSSNPLT